MKIAIVSHSAEFGGSEKCLLDMAITLRNLGHSVIVLLPKRGPLLNELRNEKIPTKSILLYWWLTTEYPRPFIIRIAAFILNLCLSLFLAPWLFFNRIDLVVTNTIASPLGALSAQMVLIPHFWYIHEVIDSCIFDLGNTFSRKLIDYLSKNIIINSEWNFKVSGKYFPAEKTKLLFPYISIQKPEQSNHKRLSPHTTALVAGRIEPLKNQIEAIHALHSLNSSGKKTTLILLGELVDQQYAQEIKKTIHHFNLDSDVVFMDFTTNITEVFCNVDALIIPSRRESLCRVAFEAMLMGIPVVAANNGAMTHNINCGVTGHLYRPGNIDQLVEKLKLLSENALQTKKIKENAMAFAQKKCCPEKFSVEISQLVQNIASL